MYLMESISPAFPVLFSMQSLAYLSTFIAAAFAFDGNFMKQPFVGVKKLNHSQLCGVVKRIVHKP